jgi:hypothetical protein
MKNVDPKIPSVMEKLVLAYSKPCKPVKMIAKTAVKINPKIASILFPAVIA